MKTPLLSLMFFCVLCQQVQSQTLIRWDFEDNVTSTLQSTFISDPESVSVNPVAFSNLFPPQGMSVFTTGVSGQPTDRASNVRGWRVDTSEGHWLIDWIEFRFFVDTGVVLIVDSVSLWYKKNNIGPRRLEFRSHKDGYSEPLDSVMLLESDVAWHKWSIPLDSFFVSGFEQVTFRIYGTNALVINNGILANDSVAIFGRIIPPLEVDANVLLSGPWNGTDMSDSLRSKGLIPLTDPYGFGKTISPSVLATTGPNAIVDWVEVELRDSLNPSIVSAESAFLLQRDGDVVAVDGVSLPRFYVDAGQYYVAVSHRNHLAVMTASPVELSSPVNFTSPILQTWGIAAQKSLGIVNALWPGNTKPASVGDAAMYTGSGNDRDPILIMVGSTTPNNTVSGYHANDANLDGLVKYTGTQNDRDIILQTVGGSTPNAVRFEQTP